MLLKQFKLTYLITLTLTIFCGCAKEVLEKDIQQINSTQVTTKDALLDLGNAFDRIENLYYLNDSIKSWKGFTDIVLADPNLKEFITKRPQIANLKNQNVSEEEIFSSLVKKNYLIRSSKIEQINKHRLMLMNIRQILAKHYTENRGTDLNSLLKLYAQNTFGVKKLMSSETYQQVKSYEQPITNRIYNVKSIGLNSVIKNKLKAATSLGGITYKVTMYDTPGSYLGAFDCPGNVYILDGAENAGFDLPYSCRCGADAASAAKLIEGTVDQSDQSYLSDCQME